MLCEADPSRRRARHRNGYPVSVIKLDMIPRLPQQKLQQKLQHVSAEDPLIPIAIRPTGLRKRQSFLVSKKPLRSLEKEALASKRKRRVAFFRDTQGKDREELWVFSHADIVFPETKMVHA